MTDDTQYFKHPRLYIDTDFTHGGIVNLTTPHAHYLKNVLRKAVGDHVRVFNGRDGEYIAQLTQLNKKTAIATLNHRLKPQPSIIRRTHLLFSPIKKYRQDILVEKAVELGVTDFHPVFMARTQGKNFKTERVKSQIIEAAEQCERLMIPTLHTTAPLAQVVKTWDKNTPLYWANERGHDTPLNTITVTSDVAFLIGPEGGFSDEECMLLSDQKHITPITLGNTIYRVETAAIICLLKAHMGI